MRVSKISVSISVIAILIGFWIQSNLIINYELATGKTQALYGLKQLAYLKYSVIGIVSLLLSLYSIIKKEKLKTILISLGLSIVAILIFVLDLWKCFV